MLPLIARHESMTRRQQRNSNRAREGTDVRQIWLIFRVTERKKGAASAEHSVFRRI
jgi:hypothetical protein